MIGRRGQKDAVSSFKLQAPGKPWFMLGWAGMLVAGLILSFYSVVGGWILSYLIRAISFNLTNNGDSNFASLFNQIIQSPWEVIIAQAAFMLLTIVIVQGGIKGGIEKASTWMMPLLFIFFIVLAIRSLTLDGAMEGVKFMFVPDWSFINGNTFLVALGMAFFSLSVGVACMITYASYLPRKESIVNAGMNVAGMNILISILAGLVIFPAVFALGYTPDQGPGLVFIILPAVFEQIPLGGFFLILFFILLLFATLTSSISLLEMVVSIGVGEKAERRKKTSWLFGFIIFLIGIPSALSFGVLSGVSILDRSIFDFMDFFTNSIGMPIGALGVAFFVGYYYSKEIAKQELQASKSLFTIWWFAIRYLAPIAILAILIQGIRPLF